MCNPSKDIDWVITDNQTCDAQNADVGTGTIVINENGMLIMINYANVTAEGIELNRKDDCVFIDRGSEMRLG